MSCDTCIHRKKPGAHDAMDVICSKGAAAESYCIGGAYELYESRDAKPVEQQFMSEPVIEAQSDPFPRPSIEEEERIMTLIDAVHSGKVKPEDLSDEDRQIIEDFAQKQAAQIEQMKTTMADFEQRPKSTEEGFNGKSKTVGTNMDTCEGCKYHSMLGCFLHKYYDCVDHQRYLYESDVIPTKQKGAEEKIEDAEDIQFIDDKLHTTQLPFQKKKPKFRAEAKPINLEGTEVDETELRSEISELGEDAFDFGATPIEPPHPEDIPTDEVEVEAAAEEVAEATMSPQEDEDVDFIDKKLEGL